MAVWRWRGITEGLAENERALRGRERSTRGQYSPFSRLPSFISSVVSLPAFNQAVPLSPSSGDEWRRASVSF
ncbi:hypothetical protein J6590_100649 [Homalodisca vitripennis]|nr:hypothetical protein J6590_100649 [Homalodisca vitripennis]